jgi:hypothetical protein
MYCQHLIRPSPIDWLSVVAARRTVPVETDISKPVKLTVVARLPRYLLLANCLGSLVLTKRT